MHSGYILFTITFLVLSTPQVIHSACNNNKRLLGQICVGTCFRMAILMLGINFGCWPCDSHQLFDLSAYTRVHCSQAFPNTHTASFGQSSVGSAINKRPLLLSCGVGDRFLAIGMILLWYTPLIETLGIVNWNK